MQLSRTFLLLAFFNINVAYAITPLPPDVPLPKPNGETTASLSCIYGLTNYDPGCRVDHATEVPQGGSGAIVIIDGQDDPNAYTELVQFSSQLAGKQVLDPCNGTNTNQPCFQQYYVKKPFDSFDPCMVANGTAGSHDIGPTTDVEPALDIEWAHAMAPKASIYMVETQGWGDTSDPSHPDISSLIHGVACATNLLLKYNGGGIISYSHSFSEWADEAVNDSNFQTPGIIYIMSAGDYSKPANYPATSPYVIAAGGTMIERDSTGAFMREVAWNDTSRTDCTDNICKTGGSGGPSLYESRPAYQDSVQKIVGTQRGNPDISFAASGVDVFCCLYTTVGPPATNNNCCDNGKTACETVPACAQGKGAWVKTGGTSLASPALAGVINSAHSGATSSTEELRLIYAGAIKNYQSYWEDIIIGNNGYPALRGYDFTTGLGSPRGYKGK